METLLYVVSAVLAALTVSFAFAIFRNFVATQKDRIAEERSRFEYTQESLSGLTGNVESLHGKVDAHVIPRLDALYSKLTADTRFLTTSDLIQIFKSLGYHLTPATTNGAVCFMGLTHLDYKISFLVGVSADDSTVYMRSFAFAVSQLGAEVLSALLNLTALAPGTSIGLEPLEGKNVIVADVTLPALGTSSVSPQFVNTIIAALTHRQAAIADLLKRYKTSFEEILFSQYVDALPINSQTGAKNIQIGSSPEVIQSWLAGPAR